MLDTNQENLEQGNSGGSNDRIFKEFELLFSNESFISGYVDLKTQAQVSKIRELEKKLQKEVERKARLQIECLACELLSVSSIQEGQKMGKEWGKALKDAKKILKKMESV